jgi:hypothetical protein
VPVLVLTTVPDCVDPERVVPLAVVPVEVVPVAENVKLGTATAIHTAERRIFFIKEKDKK